MNNRITEILGSRYPLILGPMRMITLGEMAATVAESGGFGQIAASGMSAEALRTEIEKAGKLTEGAFGINIPVYRPNALEAIEIAIEMGIKTITTSAGNPAKVIDRIKDAGIRVLHKVSTVGMALKAQEAGVDGVIATGFEAGGHVGRENITTFCLIPQLVDILNIPVVAAGGIGNGRGLLAALALGAEGVEVGTRFLATRECSSPDWLKESIVQAKDVSTVILGKAEMPIRVLRNKRAEWVSNPDKVSEDQQIRENGDNAYMNSGPAKAIIPAGQVAGLIKEIKAISDIFPDMVKEAQETAANVNTFLTEDL